MLDPVQQRIIGVLIEKELAVPDSYPLTVSALVAGCNQKSNRDPEMSVEIHDLDRALVHLLDDGWVVRVEPGAGSRSLRYRHVVDERLGLDVPQRAIVAELLVRGPQAPGALKSRLPRMSVEMQPAEILDVLRALREREPALTEQLPRQPRERDWRWQHTFGQPTAESAPPPPPMAIAHPDTDDAEPAVSPTPSPSPSPTRIPTLERLATPSPESTDDLAERVVSLEAAVRELRAELAALRERLGD